MASAEPLACRHAGNRSNGTITGNCAGVYHNQPVERAHVNKNLGIPQSTTLTLTYARPTLFRRSPSTRFGVPCFSQVLLALSATHCQNSVQSTTAMASSILGARPSLALCKSMCNRTLGANTAICMREHLACLNAPQYAHTVCNAICTRHINSAMLGPAVASTPMLVLHGSQDSPDSLAAGHRPVLRLT